MTHKPYDAEEEVVGGSRPPDPAAHNGMAYREPARPEPKLAPVPPAPRRDPQALRERLPNDFLKQARKG